MKRKPNKPQKPPVDITPLCVRVLVNADGFAVRPHEAAEHYGIYSKVIFQRADGFTLGAPADLERVALAMWTDDWVSFGRWPLYAKQPMREYRIPAGK